MLWNVAAQGYPFELIGICYYVMFLLMSRKTYAARYSLRSRVLTLLAAMFLIGAVPFHYGANAVGIAIMLAVAIAAVAATALDLRRR